MGDWYEEVGVFGRTPHHPEDLPLHTCGGVTRIWLRGDRQPWTAKCEQCGGAPLPEQKYWPKHASFNCNWCHKRVGLCGRNDLDDLLREVVTLGFMASVQR